MEKGEVRKMAKWYEDGTYLIYVRDVFVGKSKGRDQAAAINKHISNCGFESVSQYARECFANSSDITARRAGVWQ